MPRGGSKKGEHRGNAKARTGMETPNEVLRGAVKLVRKPAKPGKPGPQNIARTTIEEDLLTSQIVHGRKSAYDLSPKEVMLDNMHHFQNGAYTSEAMIQVALRAPAGDGRTKVIVALELDAERLRRLASDEAYKVAPFIHPRLSAVAVSANAGTGESIVRTMLDEIDRLNREHPMVIEHMPQKRTA